mmetsp:Transcript_29472/g.80993  ORF Transcript_29472/g.80993 Transcript_29472/m.80993 type:complete len:234 (-) Transcript_29472:83-784(-)
MKEHGHFVSVDLSSIERKEIALGDDNDGPFREGRESSLERDDVVARSDVPEVSPQERVDVDLLSFCELSGMAQQIVAETDFRSVAEDDSCVSLVSSLTTVPVSDSEENLQDEPVLISDDNGFEDNNNYMNWEILSNTPSVISFVTDPIQCLRYQDMLLKGGGKNNCLVETLQKPFNEREARNETKPESSAIGFSDALQWWEDAKRKNFNAHSGSSVQKVVTQWQTEARKSSRT